MDGDRRMSKAQRQMLDQLDQLIQVKKIMESDRKHILIDFTSEQLEQVRRYVESFYE